MAMSAAKTNVRFMPQRQEQPMCPREIGLLPCGWQRAWRGTHVAVAPGTHLASRFTYVIGSDPIEPEPVPEPVPEPDFSSDRARAPHASRAGLGLGLGTNCDEVCST